MQPNQHPQQHGTSTNEFLNWGRAWQQQNPLRDPGGGGLPGPGGGVYFTGGNRRDCATDPANIDFPHWQGGQISEVTLDRGHVLGASGVYQEAIQP